MNLSSSPAARPSIYDKIRKARELHDTWCGVLHNDPLVRTMLMALKEKIEASQRSMHELGVVAICKRCDEEEGGSCCGAGIENRYSPLLLLINLLLGGALPDERLMPDSCFFLGRRGCCLTARQVLCVNYLCLKIQKMLDHDDLVTVQNTVGDELDTLFVLHEKIRKIIGCSQ